MSELMVSGHRRFLVARQLRGTRSLWLCLTYSLLAICSGDGHAQQSGDAAGSRASEAVTEVERQTVLTGLRKPAHVAVRPGGTPQKHEVLVAETSDNRLIRIVSDSPEERSELARSLWADNDDVDESSHDSPADISFLDHQHLAVAHVQQGRGSLSIVRFTEADVAAQIVAKLKVDLNDEQDDAFSAHPLLRIAVGQDAVLMLVAARGVFRAELQGPIPDDPQLLLRASGADRTLASRAIAVNPREGKPYLLLGRTSSKDDLNSSRITFVDPYDGCTLLELPVPLLELVDLAYSPATGLLYAVGSAANGEKQSGIYRLDADLQAGRVACRATLIARLPRPSSLAFAPGGSLYVTTQRGTPASDTGELVLIKDRL